jgi:hypothetical protein
MKPVITILVAALAAAGLSAGKPAELSTAGQARLDAELAGRTAGPATTCVPQRDIRHTRTIADGVMLFEGRNDTLWVNRGSGGCAALRFGRAFHTVTPSTSLCRGDVVTVFDPTSGTEFGGCSLDDFVPYRRPS